MRFPVRGMVAAVLVLLAGGLWAEGAEAVYTEGGVKRKDLAGSIAALEIGDAVRTGESVMTKSDGRAELKLSTGTSSIKISPNTVFVLTEKVVGGARQAVLQTVSGSVTMKFGKLAGKEPLVGTSTCVAGVRGTEVTVFAGMDGSSLVAVSSGAVRLESAGSAVDLVENEAVEVRPGQAPGAKFAWLGKELDYSKWNQGRLEDFLADPADAARKVQAQMAEYRDSMLALLPVLESQRTGFAEANAKLKALLDAKDPKADEYRAGTVFPLVEAQATTFLNIRYYALSILSMRRFVIGDMYMQLKSRHMLDPANPALVEFLGVYASVLADFEATIAPQLVEADI